MEEAIIEELLGKINCLEKQVEALESREIHSHNLFNNHNVSMLLINPSNGNIVDANPAACKFYGYSHKVLTTMNVLELNTLPEKTLKQKLESVKSGTESNFIFQHKMSDGSIRDVEVSAGLTFVNSEELIYSIIIDVTERLQFERSILLAKENAEEREKQFRAVFENSKDAIGISQYGICVMVNRAYLDMFGYESSNEIIGKSLLDQISPKEHFRISEFIRNRHSGEYAPTFYESIGIRKNGEEFSFELNISTYLLNNEMYSVGILRDITTRKQLEKALKENEHKFRTAFMTGNSANVIVGRDNGIILEVNDRMVELYGYSREEFIGHNTHELGLWVYPEQRSKMVELLRSNGRIYNMEVFARRKGGETFWVQYSVS